MDGDYFFTEHFIERMKERFPNLSLPWDDRWQLYKDLDKMIRNSREERRYLNDTRYMFYLHETYGYDARYEFLANTENNILFVVSLSSGFRKIVKTCMPLNTCEKFIPTKKYQVKVEKQRKIPKKRKGSLFNEFEAQEEYMNNAGENLPLSEDKSYKLILNKQGVPHAIKCLKCKMISYNSNDVREKYCGNCHQFFEFREDGAL